MKRFKILFVLAILCALSYGALWILLARNLETQSRITLENLRHSGILVETRSLTLSGFPGTPEVRFSGALHLPELDIGIPDLKVRSFLIPGLPFTAEIAQPVSLSGPANLPTILRLAESLQQARVTILLPVRWPRDNYEDTLHAWREDGGAIEIREIFAAFSGGAGLSGAGEFDLDNELNPQGVLDIILTDPAALVALLGQAGILKKDHTTIATMITGALAKPDEKTGRPAMKADLRLSNRVLTLGPLKIGELPRAAWPRRLPPLDTRNSPDPPR